MTLTGESTTLTSSMTAGPMQFSSSKIDIFLKTPSQVNSIDVTSMWHSDSCVYRCGLATIRDDV